MHRLAIVDDEFLTPLPRTLLSRMRRSSSGRAIWRGREASVQTAGLPAWAVFGDEGTFFTTLRSTPSSPYAETLEKIERGLLDVYGDRAEPPCWMVRFVKTCGLDPNDPLIRWLTQLAEPYDEFERRTIDALSGHWPTHHRTEAALKKAQQRERAALRVHAPGSDQAGDVA